MKRYEMKVTLFLNNFFQHFASENSIASQVVSVEQLIQQKQ